MEGVLELILTILFLPFEEKEKRFLSRIDRINNKPLRIFVKIVIPLTILIAMFALVCLISYFIKGN